MSCCTQCTMFGLLHSHQGNRSASCEWMFVYSFGQVHGFSMSPVGMESIQYVSVSTVSSRQHRCQILVQSGIGLAVVLTLFSFSMWCLHSTLIAPRKSSSLWMPLPWKCKTQYAACRLQLPFLRCSPLPNSLISSSTPQTVNPKF